MLQSAGRKCVCRGFKGTLCSAMELRNEGDGRRASGVFVMRVEYSLSWVLMRDVSTAPRAPLNMTMFLERWDDLWVVEIAALVERSEV